MMAGIESLADAQLASDALAELGYQPRPHRVDAALYVKVHEGADTHSLQLTEPGSDLWRERLTFRDALLADPEFVREYADLKHRLLCANGGRVYNAADKRAFVRRVLAANGIDLRDDRHVTR
jgi:GrpB-like predicted nucleotidyltransferase (UPF0157 family)